MKTLPSDEKTFTVKIVGEKTGRVYEGSFTFKLPDLMTETKIDKLNARLSEGLDLSVDIALLHDILSYLTYTLVDAPAWWSEELVDLKTRDFNVYTELRKLCIEFEKSWNDEVWGDRGEDSTKKSKKSSKVS